MIEAETREVPVAEPAEDARNRDLQRARARAYLDLFERHVLRVALRCTTRDAPFTRKR